MEIIDVEYTKEDSSMTIKDGFKFGVGFMLAYALYMIISFLLLLATGGMAMFMSGGMGV